MSLTLTAYNTYGIVMSADKRLTTTIPVDNNRNETFVLTDNENKLYQLPNNWGLSYAGTSSFGTQPTATIITSYIQNTTFDQTLTPKTWLKQLTNHLKEHHLSETHNIILMLCGYQNKQPFVLTTNTKTVIIKTANTKPYGFVYAGANDTLEPLLSMYPCDYAKYPLQEFIEYLDFLNKTVAKLQHYQQRTQEVSKNCDILVIDPKTSYWASRYK